MSGIISDNLLQFAIILNMFGNMSGNKCNIYERDWENLFKIAELNADNLTQMYLNKINMLLDIYIPLKGISKYKLKFNFKSLLLDTYAALKRISKKKLRFNFKS